MNWIEQSSLGIAAFLAVLGLSYSAPAAAGILARFSKRLILAGAVAVLVFLPAMAQNGEMQQKLAEVKQVAAENKQQLHQYQWTETTQLTLKGDPKPASTYLCRYGPDGQVQKTLTSPPPEEPSGGRLKQRIIEKKKAEIEGYMEQVKGLLSIYVPPDPQGMEQAYQAGKFALNPVPGAMNLVFTDYAEPGDRMTIRFDTTTKKIISLDVNTY